MKNKDWKEVYKLPIIYDGCSYCWTQDMVMAIHFDSELIETDRLQIVKCINGVNSVHIKGLSVNGCDFSINGVHVFSVRGWGHLTGTGCMNLSEKRAIEIQDGFINHIKQTLLSTIPHRHHIDIEDSGTEVN